MNTYDLEIIGNFLAERRKACGYTQSQLAELINTSFKTISSWENGHSFPDLTYQLDLCKYLKISLEELHNGRIDKKKRLINRVVKISLYIVIFLIILILPSSLYLYNYYNKSYDSFHIYNVDFYDEKNNLLLTGNFVEYYKYNTLFLSLIDNKKISNKDIVGLNIYCNDNLIYNLIIDDYTNISLNNKYDSKDKWTYKLFINNKEIANGNITFALNEKRAVNSLFDDNINNNQDRIINNLKKHGFKDNKDSTLVKIINKNENIYYFMNDYKLCYYYDDDYINKIIEYHTHSATINGHIYYSNNRDNTVVERFTYNYETNEYNCLSMQCSNMNDLVKLMKKYITLLYEE